MRINSVLGSMTFKDLGMTLIHEHFLFGLPGWQGDATISPFDRSACVDTALKMTETVPQEELIGFCKEHLESYKAPSAI